MLRKLLVLVAWFVMCIQAFCSDIKVLCVEADGTRIVLHCSRSGCVTPEEDGKREKKILEAILVLDGSIDVTQVTYDRYGDKIRIEVPTTMAAFTMTSSVIEEHTIDERHDPHVARQRKFNFRFSEKRHTRWLYHDIGRFVGACMKECDKEMLSQARISDTEFVVRLTLE